jgi:hypothetical protein
MLEVPEITSKRQWRSELRAAREKNAELSATRFAWTVVSAIEGRLNAMEAIANSGRAPTLADREYGMGLGMIALRGLYARAPELSRMLLRLTSGFDGWASLPEA